MTLQPALVIFDMDGTLIKSEHEYFCAQANRIFAEMSLPTRDDKHISHLISEDRFREILEDEDTPNSRIKFWDIYNRTVEPAPARVIPGAHEAIEYCIENGATVALATARPWPESQVRKHLQDTALLNQISVVSTWHGKHNEWNSKKVQLLQVCEQLGIDPAVSAKVGDLPADVVSAYQAGLGLAVSVLTGNIKREVLVNAANSLQVPTRHLIINTVSDLQNHLYQDS